MSQTFKDPFTPTLFSQRFASILRILSGLVMMFSLSMLPPILIYFFYQDGILSPFLISFILTFSAGFLTWLIFRKNNAEIKARGGFLVVTLFWVALCFFGALPLYFNFYPHLSFTDALFEAVSGLSTTGATVLSNLDAMPHAILYYRQQLTLLGGVGVIVLALAILPILGIGGMQLYAAETAGPVKTSKLRPRLAQTAKALWLIYMGLIAACALCFWAAGMDGFDAITTSFSTLATAGFSTHDQNIAYYHNHIIEAVSIIFMILGGTNFGLHYQFFKKKQLNVYTSDTEFKAYLKIWGGVAIICAATLLTLGFYHHNMAGIFFNSIFSSASAITTGGFQVIDFSQWPSFLPYLLLLTALIGGCGGSTSGGMKVLRFFLLKEQSKREIKRLIHPQGVFPIGLGGKTLPENVIQGIWGFAAIYTVFFIITILALIMTGLDAPTAFGSAVGALSNTGIGLGKTALTFENISDPAKWILTFAMLAGRLEILTLLVLFIPDYWRK